MDLRESVHLEDIVEQFFEGALDLALDSNFQRVLRLLGVVGHADIDTVSPQIHGLHSRLGLLQVKLHLLAFFDLVSLLDFFKLVFPGSLWI